MPGMPDPIQKSGVMRRFEEFSNTPANASSSDLANAIAALENDPTGATLVAIAKGAKFYDTTKPEKHFQKHWLGEGPNPAPFWPGIQDKVKKTLRAGMLKAAKLFRDTKKPCQFLWVMSSPEGSTDWWMSVTEGAKTIVVIFHTPRVPCDEKLVDSTAVFIVDGSTGSFAARPAKVPVGTEGP